MARRQRAEQKAQRALGAQRLYPLCAQTRPQTHQSPSSVLAALRQRRVTAGEGTGCHGNRHRGDSPSRGFRLPPFFRRGRALPAELSNPASGVPGFGRARPQVFASDCAGEGSSRASQRTEPRPSGAPGHKLILAISGGLGEECGTQKGLAEYIPGDQSQEIRKEETLSDSFHLGFPRGKLMRNWMTSKAKGPADSASPRSLFGSV